MLTNKILKKIKKEDSLKKAKKMLEESWKMSKLEDKIESFTYGIAYHVFKLYVSLEKTNRKHWSDDIYSSISNFIGRKIKRTNSVPDYKFYYKILL